MIKFKYLRHILTLFYQDYIIKGGVKQFYIILEDQVISIDDRGSLDNSVCHTNIIAQDRMLS